MNNKKLRILQGMDSYYPDVDGVVNCLHNYCINLNEESDLTLIVPKHRLKNYNKKFPYKMIRCGGIRIPILKSVYPRPNMDKKFRQQVEAQNYDIAQFHSPFAMGKYIAKVAKQQNIPLVATYHSNMKQIFEDVVKIKWIVNILCKKLAKIYNQCDEIFVCSPLVEQQARELGCKGKITYLPFGTEIEKCENVEENRKKANELYNLTEDEIVFSYVGRIMKLKRIDFILKSLKIVKENGLKFKFFVIGKGPKLKSLQKLAKKLGLENEVIFTGFIPREHFPLLLSRADLLLFPSLYDNFGLVKVESAAFETAGLFIENSCAGYDVKHGHNGYLSKDNINDFAQQILEITKDKEKLKQTGINASNELYISWKECTNQLHERLKKVYNEYQSKKENK